MTKVLLVVLSLIAAIGVMGRSALNAGAQVARRFEYARLAPYARIQTKGTVANRQTGFRACIAAAAEWNCREFEHNQGSDTSLRLALSTLGSEGWELVSAVVEDPNPQVAGLTFLFRRQLE